MRDWDVGTSDSDDASVEGYWLRIPECWPETGTAPHGQYKLRQSVPTGGAHYRDVVGSELVGEQGDDQQQMETQTLPETYPESLGAEVQCKQSDNRQTMPNQPQSEDEQKLPQNGSQLGPPVPLRRSTRERQLRHMLTYSSLGHPTYEPCPTVNTTGAVLMPYSHPWVPNPYLPSAPCNGVFAHLFTHFPLVQLSPTHPSYTYLKLYCWRAIAHTSSSQDYIVKVVYVVFWVLLRVSKVLARKWFVGKKCQEPLLLWESVWHI